jgi:phosphatidylinositol glycan class W
MLVVTCLAILAVDFPIFPRRYAKVETWGTSLMDLGVGSFVFSAGVVSARAIVRSDSHGHGHEHDHPSQSATRNTFAARFVRALRHSAPLFILGFIRLYSVKGLDYAEHVTEYGVHWNFFFTLALLPPFVEISDTATRRVFKSYEVFAIVLTVTYELILDNTRLLSYILVSPRGPDLLAKNREGVFSFVGYLAIFLAGRGVGVPLVQFNGHKASPGTGPDLNPTPRHPIDISRRERVSVLQNLLLRSLVYTALYFLSTNLYTFNLAVSRRLANLPYVLWVVAFNSAQLFLFGLVEAVGPQFSYPAPPSQQDASTKKEDQDQEAAAARTAATSTVLRVFNGNGLATFLVANLLTGLVNLSFNTLDMAPARAMALLIGYAVAVTAVALALDVSGLKLRL